MDLKAVPTVLAAGRIAFGAGLLLAPRTLASPWIGRHARDPLTTVMIRGFGARDLALGVGGLLCLRRPDVGRVRWWYGAQALSDGVDGLATLAAGSVMDPRRRALIGAVACGSALVGAATAVLDPPVAAPELTVGPAA